MKRIFLIITVFIFVLCGCNSQDTVSTYPAINKTELNLIVGQSEKLIVSNATDVEWISDQPKIARVYYGAVTALSEGTAIITATVDGQKFECAVVVKNENSSTQTQSQTSSVLSQQSSNASQSVTPPVESPTQSEQGSSEQTHSEKVEATKETAFKLVERLTDEKYDKAIADLTKECNEIINGYKKELAEKQDRLETVGEKTAEGFMLKDSIKILNESITNTEKILKDGIESLERQREEEHLKNKEEFGVD